MQLSHIRYSYSNCNNKKKLYFKNFKNNIQYENQKIKNQKHIWSIPRERSPPKNKLFKIFKIIMKICK